MVPAVTSIVLSAAMGMKVADGAARQRYSPQTKPAKWVIARVTAAVPCMAGQCRSEKRSGKCGRLGCRFKRAGIKAVGSRLLEEDLVPGGG